MILRDVCYYIEAHFVLTDQAGPGDTEDKHYAIAVRRMKKDNVFIEPILVVVNSR